MKNLLVLTLAIVAACAVDADHPADYSQTAQATTPTVITTPIVHGVVVDNSDSEIYQMSLTGSNHDNTGDVFGFAIRNRVHFDTTLGPNQCGGVYAEARCTSTGPYGLTKMAFEGSAPGGLAFVAYAGQGKARFDDGATIGPTAITGPLTAQQGVNATGTVSTNGTIATTTGPVKLGYTSTLEVLPGALNARLSSCGTGAVGKGQDFAGRIVEGTGATGCFLQWLTPKTDAPFCTCMSQTLGNPVTCLASTTGLTVTNTSTTTSLLGVVYTCIGLTASVP